MSTDSVAITNLLYRYAECMDNGDFTGAAALFGTARIRIAAGDEGLTDAAGGATVEILRVSDRDPRLLQYLAERGLTPGATVRVEAVDELAGVITLTAAGATCTLALATASEISVRA